MADVKQNRFSIIEDDNGQLSIYDVKNNRTIASNLNKKDLATKLADEYWFKSLANVYDYRGYYIFIDDYNLGTGVYDKENARVLAHSLADEIAAENFVNQMLDEEKEKQEDDEITEGEEQVNIPGTTTVRAIKNKHKNLNVDGYVLRSKNNANQYYGGSGNAFVSLTDDHVKVYIDINNLNYVLSNAGEMGSTYTAVPVHIQDGKVRLKMQEKIDFILRPIKESLFKKISESSESESDKLLMNLEEKVDTIMNALGLSIEEVITGEKTEEVVTDEIIEEEPTSEEKEETIVEDEIKEKPSEDENE